MKDVRKFLRMYKGFVISAALLLSVFGGVVFGILPGAKKVLTLRKETDALIRQTQDLRTKTSVLANIDESLYKKYLTDLVTAVPADQSLTSLFSTIDGLAGQTGVTISDVGLTKPGVLATESARRQSTEEKEIGSNLLPFSVTVIGSYDQIRNFLDLAIRVRRFFRVRGFDLSLIDPTNVSVRIRMDAYYAPYLTVIGGVDTIIEPLTEKDEQTITKVASLPLVGGQYIPSVSTESKANPFAP